MILIFNYIYMKIKLIEDNWYLYIASYWTEYEVTQEDYNKIVSWLYKIKYEEWIFVFEDNIEAQELARLKEEQQVKLQKKESIDKIASLSDQLNLLAWTLYKLTEWRTEPEILEARKVYEDIQNILNP